MLSLHVSIIKQILNIALTYKFFQGDFGGKLINEKDDGKSGFRSISKT